MKSAFFKFYSFSRLIIYMPRSIFFLQQPRKCILSRREAARAQAHVFFLTVEKWFLKRNVAFVNNKGKTPSCHQEESVLCSSIRRENKGIQAWHAQKLPKSFFTLPFFLSFALLRIVSFFRYKMMFGSPSIFFASNICCNDALYGLKPGLISGHTTFPF